jgi:hypothetical protein
MHEREICSSGSQTKGAGPTRHRNQLPNRAMARRSMARKPMAEQPRRSHSSPESSIPGAMHDAREHPCANAAHSECPSVPRRLGSPAGRMRTQIRNSTPALSGKTLASRGPAEAGGRKKEMLPGSGVPHAQRILRCAKGSSSAGPRREFAQNAQGCSGKFRQLSLSRAKKSSTLTTRVSCSRAMVRLTASTGPPLSRNDQAWTLIRA